MLVETNCLGCCVHWPVHSFVHHFVHVHSPMGLRLRELPIKQGLSEDFGSGGRDRTYDQLINSQLLYR